MKKIENHIEKQVDIENTISILFGELPEHIKKPLITCFLEIKNKTLYALLAYLETAYAISLYEKENIYEIEEHNRNKQIF